jgi:hypothetical protein
MTTIAASPIASCVANASSDSLYAFIRSCLTVAGANANTLYEATAYLAGQAACEGPSISQGGYNPWNTTLPAPHANGETVTSKYGPITLPQGNAAYLGNNPAQNNNDPVKNFSDWASGVAATVLSWDQLKILPSLSGTFNGSTYISALSASGWGTSPSCTAQRAQEYLNDPTSLCSQLTQSVNTNGSNAGGTSTSGASGAAVPEANTGAGAVSDVTNAVGDVAGATSSVSGLIGDLTSTALWYRLGLGALGVALCTVGLFIMFSSTNTGETIESTAASAVP